MNKILDTKSKISSKVWISLFFGLFLVLGFGCAEEEERAVPIKKVLNSQATSEASIRFQTIDVSIDCAASRWICSTQQGGIVQATNTKGRLTVSLLSGTEASDVYDKQIPKLLAELPGSSIEDEYLDLDGKVAILNSPETGETHFALIRELDGKIFQCLASVETKDWESEKVNIETMCETMRVGF